MQRREDNSALVERYFSEVIDGQSGRLEDFFAEDGKIHRAELGTPIAGLAAIRAFLAGARECTARTRTTIGCLLERGEDVIAHLTHDVAFKGHLRTPFGPLDVDGKRVTWSAFARFRCRGGLIAEEWVVRDEVGIYRQLGLLDVLVAQSGAGSGARNG